MSFKDHKHYLSRFFCTFCLTLSRAATQLRIFGKLKVRVGRWETHLLLFKQGLVYLGVGTYPPNIPIKKLGLCFLGIKAWVEGYFKTHYEHCEITRDRQEGDFLVNSTTYFLCFSPSPSLTWLEVSFHSKKAWLMSQTIKKRFPRALHICSSSHDDFYD